MAAPMQADAMTTGSSARSRQLEARHSIIGVLWLVYWMTNSYDWIDDIIPFANYYFFTAIFLIYIAVARPTQIVTLLTRPGVWIWSITFIVPTVMYLSADHNSNFNYIAMRQRIVFFSIVASTALLFNDKNGGAMLRRAAGFALAMAIVVNLSEIFIANPYNRSTGGGRSAGFYADANISAHVICALLVLSVDITKQSVRGLLIAGASYVAVLLTFSRSGIVFATLLMFGYLFLPRGRGTLSTGVRITVLFSGLFLLGVIAIVAITIFDFDTRETWRLTSILTFDLTDASSQSRLEKLMFGIEQAGKYVWTGRGPGESVEYALAAHNSFVTIGYDYGIIGVVFYVGILSWGWVKTLTKGWKRAAAYGILATQFAFYSMFAHDVFITSAMALFFGVFISDAALTPVDEPPEKPTAPPEPHFTSGRPLAPLASAPHPAPGGPLHGARHS